MNGTIEPGPSKQPNYKTRAEAAVAIASLTDDEHVKLLKAARYFWFDRKLDDRWGSAGGLLNEAIQRTLDADGKRWREGVSIVFHLKQAMKNISGHLARKRNRRAEYEVELPDDTPRGASLLEDTREMEAARANDLLDELQYHFGPDQEAFEFLIRRSQGMTESEAAADIGIESSRIEAVARRCRRKVNTFKKRSTP